MERKKQFITFRKMHCWSGALLLYIRAVCTGVKNAPVAYIRAVQPKSIANNAFLYGPYIRVVYTGDRHALPVHTARTYGPYLQRVYMGARYTLPVHTARTYGPYVRPVCTAVFLTPVYTGRIYGPYIRVHF